MRIFYDTEFTSLTAQAQLLSAGFVSELGQEFYIEFDGVPKHACSPFVHQVVLPLLRAPGVPVMTPIMGLMRILEWLQAQSREVMLISDSNYDSALMGQLVRDAGGLAELAPALSLRFDVLYFNDSQAVRTYQTSAANYFQRHPGMQHHALHDARALKLATMQAEGFYG